MKRLCVLIAAWLLSPPGQAHAGAGGASLVGRVVGPDGAPIAGAQVETDPASALTRSDDAGEFTLAPPPGEYRILATLPGHRTTLSGPFRVHPGRTTRAGDLVLALAVAPAPPRPPATPPGEDAPCDLHTIRRFADSGVLPPAPVLERCKALDPEASTDFQDIYLALGKLLLEHDKKKPALRALERAVDRNGPRFRDPELRYHLVRLSAKLERWRQAEQHGKAFLRWEHLLPHETRRDRVREVLWLMARIYEQWFYKENHDDPDGDNLPLLDWAIDMAESCFGYDPACRTTAAQKSVREWEAMRQDLLEF